MLAGNAMRISLVVNHAPWRPERAAALLLMLKELGGRTNIRINDTDYRGQDWQAAKVAWALTQWRYGLATGATHCLFMTDDLHIAPRFWDILEAIIEAHPNDPIGFLSNHPKGPELARNRALQVHGYRTNSWLVGPCYLLPRAILAEFLPWFEAKAEGNAPGGRGYGNDDSTLNEFITKTGRTTWHPLPTIIEHRHDLESTTGHGDKYSRERVSWRECREVEVVDDAGNFRWVSYPFTGVLPEDLTDAEYWRGHAPLLSLPES
jgi:hypothetical protein